MSFIQNTVFCFKEFGGEPTAPVTDVRKDSFFLCFERFFCRANVSFNEVFAEDGAAFLGEIFAKREADGRHIRLRFGGICSVFESEEHAGGIDESADFARITDTTSQSGGEFQRHFPIDIVKVAVCREERLTAVVPVHKIVHDLVSPALHATRICRNG